MDCSFILSCSRSVLFAETLWWNVNNVFTRRTHRSTHINNFTNGQEYSGSCLKRWEGAWAVVNALDCRLQPFIGSTSPLFHSVFPCHRGRRHGWKPKDCCKLGTLWVDLERGCSTYCWRGRYRSACVIGGYWLSTLTRRRASALWVDLRCRCGWYGSACIIGGYWLSPLMMRGWATALWVHLRRRWGRYGNACVIRDYWWSPLMKGWATTPREQALEWSQQRFLRVLSWRIWHVDVKLLEVEIAWWSKSLLEMKTISKMDRRTRAAEFTRFELRIFTGSTCLQVL